MITRLQSLRQPYYLKENGTGYFSHCGIASAFSRLRLWLRRGKPTPAFAVSSPGSMFPVPSCFLPG
jgi:hypothetical protein